MFRESTRSYLVGASKFYLARLCSHSSYPAYAPPPPIPIVEYMTDPIVLDIPAPRFFWLPQSSERGATQAAYQVVVNMSSKSGGAAVQVWDSGVVASAASAHVAYAGAALVSDAVYTWAVQWTDAHGVAAPWSAPARFGTGLMTQGEWAPAAWIGCPLQAPGGVSFTQLRAEFSLSAAPGVTVTQARAYITAVGYYSLRVNGAWAPQWGWREDGGGVERPRLDPGWSTYEVRSLYNAYDLTRVLSASGPNAIAITLGNGWPDIGPVPGNASYSAPLSPAELVAARLAGPLSVSSDDNSGASREARMIVVVHTSDGASATWTTTAAGFQRISGAVEGTDGAWQCGAGALLYDSVYNGCTVDARLETVGWDVPGYVADGNWTNALLKADPGGAHPTTMTAQTFPSVSVQIEVAAVAISSPSVGVYVFDFGQNLAGIARVTLPAPVASGITITLRHAELLQHPPYGPKDGNIYVGNLRGAKATDVYTTRGTSEDAEVFEPVFTYHGFRLLEITGLPFAPTLDTVTALYSRTGVARAGDVVFPSTANTLNQLQHAVSWGIGCNLMSVISDCPQRDERKGWCVRWLTSHCEGGHNHALAL